MSIEETWQADDDNDCCILIRSDAGVVRLHIDPTSDDGRPLYDLTERESYAFLRATILADHNRASSLDATLARAQTAEAALAETNTQLQAVRDAYVKDFGAEVAEHARTKAALAEAEAALRDLAQKLKLPSSRALVRAALARIDQHPTQEAVDDHD